MKILLIIMVLVIGFLIMWARHDAIDAEYAGAEFALDSWGDMIRAQQGLPPIPLNAEETP